MKLAIMQPYFLPYIGYFRLMAAADKFVVYDDVNFIKGGWINRNRILLNDQEHLISVPLQGASSNRRINQITLSPKTTWRKKLIRTLEQAYKRAPEFGPVSQLLDKIINYAENNLAAYLLHSLELLKSYLALEVDLVPTSSKYENAALKGQLRVLDICRRENASVYLNLSGGKNLYDSKVFASHGIKLRFLEPPEIEYQQFGNPFRPSLSIIDVLMFNSVEKIKSAFLYPVQERS